LEGHGRARSQSEGGGVVKGVQCRRRSRLTTESGRLINLERSACPPLAAGAYA
jgi:hypothetical protein